MEFATRLCRPGDERVLSLVAQATILETYAGITNGGDLVTYVNAELSPADFSRMLIAFDYGLPRRASESALSATPLPSLMKARDYSPPSNSSGSTSSTDFTGTE
jgi:hypothetical protein